MATSLQHRSTDYDQLTAALRQGAALAHRRGELRLAEMLYREILGYSPQDPEALHALRRLGIVDTSIPAGRSEHAPTRLPATTEQDAGNASQVRVEPAYKPAAALLRRAAALQAQGRSIDALSFCDAAVIAAPRSAEAHSLRGRIQRELGMLEAALESFLTALTQHDDPRTKFALGCLYLLCGDLDQGWPLYDQYRWAEKSFAPGPGRADVPPRWNGEDVRGKVLRLVQDQDVSDTLQFARYALLARARGATVVLAVQDTLCPLLQSLSPAVRVVVESSALEVCDFECALSTLPGLFATTLETIPAEVRYLQAEPARAQRWRERLGGDDFRIGICWRSEQSLDAGDRRSFSLQLLEPIARLPGVRVISLQPGGRTPEDELPPGMTLHQLGPEFDSSSDVLAETAAVIACLDLVITCDCAITHLAGCLGVQTWVALPQTPDWRWLLERRDSPWYPSVSLFRQSADGGYNAVMECMRAALGTLLDQHRAATVESRAPLAVIAAIPGADAALNALSEQAGDSALAAPSVQSAGHWTVRVGQAWMRSPRAAPQLVSVVLLAALCAESVGTIKTLLAHESGLPMIAGLEGNDTVLRGIDVGPIVDAHLFGEAERTQDAAAAFAAVDLKLTGTLATNDPQHGFAIIGEEGKSNVYRVGQSVGDVALQAIYKDRVVVQRNGALASLFLPRYNLDQSPVIVSTLPAGNSTPAAETEQATPAIDKYADSNLEEDPSGNLLGIRVVPGQDRAGFANSGLIGGDIVVAMNGQKITSESTANIWKQASTGTAVTVLRRGVLKDITLNFGN